ncbi:MAG: S24 family peptidase [Lentisphaerota bacterium]
MTETPVSSSVTGLVAGELRSGKSVRLEVGSSSMAPTLKPGDILTVTPLGARPVRCGEMVVMRCEAELLAHRVLRILEDGGNRRLVCCGDRSGTADLPVAAEQILGRVTMRTRGNKTIRFDSGWGRMTRYPAVCAKRLELFGRTWVRVLRKARAGSRISTSAIRRDSVCVVHE